jgi:PAS domain S-box-containing protein
MQLLLLMIALPVMFLAASVDERRRSADLVKKAFHANPAGVAITTVADGRIIEMNDSFERLLGYARAEAMGRTKEELGIWLSVDDRRRSVDLLRAQGRLRDLPVRLRRRDGEPRRMLLSAEPVESEGREAMLALLTDVTDQQRAEELKAQVQSQLQQTDRLEALGQLAGGIAHDFNNVLQAVKGYTELALESLAPDHPAVSPLSHVNDAADRAATFTGHLLAFSRRDAPRTERLCLNSLVVATGGLLQHALGGHVHIAIAAAPNQPTLHGDRARIEQVLMNLCINARDAMTAGGVITIETGEVELTTEDCHSRPWARPGHWVFFRVVDRGTGIPDAVRPHIFEPFFTTKPPGQGGSGLGLSTVYAIVERHRGLISVDSTVGVGSTFTVYFPSAGPMPAVATVPAREEAPLHGRGETILLAEDEPAVRDVAVEMLQGANYEVLVACDGAEAETIIRARAADLDAVILDVVMPHRNGRQVYDTLRGVRPEVPVVFCTGYSFGELSDLEQITGRSVLSKPYSRASLLGAVRGAIDTARSFRTNRVRD